MTILKLNTPVLDMGINKKGIVKYLMDLVFVVEYEDGGLRIHDNPSNGNYAERFIVVCSDKTPVNQKSLFDLK